MIEDTNLGSLINFYKHKFYCLNLEKVCTGDYYTVVELNNGSQGAAINYFNVHGPDFVRFDFAKFDKYLLELRNIDRLLYNCILTNGELGFAEKSVKIGILNALSSPLLEKSRLGESNLELIPGYFDLKKIVKP